MATNGRIVPSPQKCRRLPVPNGRLSGQAVLSGATLGNRHGVLLTDEGKGGNIAGEATVAGDGSFVLPITTTTAAAKGAPCYITTGHVLTPVATSNQLFGYFEEAKGTSTGNFEISIAPQV